MWFFFSHLLSYCFYNLPYTCRLSLYRFYCRCSFILRYKFAVSHWKPNLIDKLCLSSPPVSILSPIMWILDHMYILLFELFWITTTFIVNFNFNESFIINIFFPSFKNADIFSPCDWFLFFCFFLPSTLTTGLVMAQLGPGGYPLNDCLLYYF